MVTKGEYEKQQREQVQVSPTPTPEPIPVGPCRHLITFNQGERIIAGVKVTTICFECRSVIHVS